MRKDMSNFKLKQASSKWIFLVVTSILRKNLFFSEMEKNSLNKGTVIRISSDWKIIHQVKEFADHVALTLR